MKYGICFNYNNEKSNEESNNLKSDSSRCGMAFGSCKSGYCCSKYGWCGKSSAYCSKDEGCQSQFGHCW